MRNIYMPLLTTNNQSSGKQSKSRDVTRSRSQSGGGGGGRKEDILHAQHLHAFVNH